jgi:class 3 adenylate cyclase/tetratricopeptide (TPR) repeat protein
VHCPSCGAPTAASDRFCSTCGHDLARRCETCGTVLPEDARFCPSCGTAVRGTEADPEPERADEERKVVSVLYADLVGFTAASDGEDPEDVQRRLRPYHEALRDEVERHGGRIEKLMGDGVLAVFGAPVVHEDDPERAVRAGLRIQEAIGQLAGSTGLSARVAIATGEAMVLVEGTTMDREGLVGDVVNTASRLQHEAPPGTVLVDKATHHSTHRTFRYEERAPVAVKGKSEPLQVWLAVEPTGRFGAAVDDIGATLVGRSSELSLLVHAFARAVSDHTSQLVTMGGEPGVGKSRLVRELRRHVDDLPDLVRWRQGRCLPYGEGITYWAFGQIVKAEAGILETDSRATAVGKLRVALEPLVADADERVWVAGRLARLVGSDDDASADRSERFAAWHRFVNALGEQRPTVLVVEDLQWADPALVGFLSEVPQNTRGIPLLLLCTARPDFFEEHPSWGGGQRNAITVGLDPLDLEATSTLLDELLEGEGLEDETRRMIMDRSGGNPLWTQEFVRMMRERPGQADLAIPDTVQAIVAARIDLLEPEVKTAVQAASTVGKSFWVGGVAASLGKADGLDEAMRELSRRELIRRERISTMEGEIEYAFTHSVVQEVAYAQAPRPVRAQRHHRVARWLERLAGDRVSDRAEVIAHHDAEALRLAVATHMDDVTVFTEAAIESHRRAAEQAGRLDKRAERGHLESALELIPDGDPRRGDLLLRLGATVADLGALDEGRKLLLEARQQLLVAGDLEGWGRAMSWLNVYSWVAGEPEEADRFLDQAIERLSAERPGPALATAYGHKVWDLWLRGDSERALEVVERVRDIVEVHGGLPARRNLRSAEGGARFDLGDSSAIEWFREEVRVALETDDSNAIVRAHNNLGAHLRTGWGVAEAVAVHERGLEVATQRNTRGAAQFLQGTLAFDYFLMGRWDAALEAIAEVMALSDRLGYLEGGKEALRIAIEECRSPQGLVERMDQLVANAEGLKDLQALVPANEAALWQAIAIGDDERALRIARRIVEASGATLYLLDAAAPTVWTLYRLGEVALLAPLVEGLGRFDMPRPRATLAMIAALQEAGADPMGTVESLAETAAEQAAMQVATESLVSLALAAHIAAEHGEDERAEELRRRARQVMAEAEAPALLEALAVG